jgi:uncharacterized protein (DUF885 family)
LKQGSVPISLKKLGDTFNISEFHDEVPKDGALPLQLLEEKLNQWIENKMKEG